MKAFIAATMVVLMATPSLATDCLQMPPEKYRHEPKGNVTIKYVSQDAVNRKCDNVEAAAAGLGNAVGCSIALLRYIWIVKKLKPRFKEAVLVHEKAHVNGWPGDHPGATLECFE